MALVQLVFLFVLATLVRAKYPTDQYYKEMNCPPIKREGESEPSRFDCSHLQDIQEGKCYLNGKHYNDGDTVLDTEINNNCLTHCICRVDTQRKSAKFFCANVECPRHPVTHEVENCFLQFSHENCCGKLHCDKDGAVETCEYDGQTYKEGEHFYPDEDKCLSCVCMKGYNGTEDEPWCRKYSCDLFVHYAQEIREGCVPTYYREQDCCPITTWRCPDDEPEKILGDPNPNTKSDDNMCEFGKVKLYVGQKLEQDRANPCIDCSCITPPHISCVMNTTCHPAGF